MKIIKMVGKLFVSFFTFVTTPNPNNRSKVNSTIDNNNETKINPATGLPMNRGLDILGNSIGSSASDRNNNWHNDYYHQNSSYSSRYDPFTNRY